MTAVMRVKKAGEKWGRWHRGSVESWREAGTVRGQTAELRCDGIDDFLLEDFTG